MARAAFYYYVPDSWCIFCHRATEETRIVANPVQDLSESTVGIPCHRACWRRRVVAGWLRFVLWTLAVALLLGGVELLLRRIGSPPPWRMLSAGVLLLNAGIGTAAGAAAGLRAHGRRQKQIQDYIQLRTYPYD